MSVKYTLPFPPPQVDRAGTSTTIQPIKVAKDTTWKSDIFSDIVKACETQMIPDVQIPQSDVTKVVNPLSKEEMIASFRSRLGRKL